MRDPPLSFVSHCYRTPYPTTIATTWPPGGSYLSSFVERRQLASEAFVVDYNCFLDHRTFPCSMRTSVCAWIWNSLKYKAFKFFQFSSCKAQDYNYSKTTTKFDSLLKFKIKQILIRFLANPQLYIWRKPPQHVATTCNFLMTNLSHYCF
jgi:hypothetical protein